MRYASKEQLQEVWRRTLAKIRDTKAETEGKIPTKVSALENDAGYMKESRQQGVINAALARAKASGEFDGKDGQDGYTPVKGVDYFDGEDGVDGADGRPGKDGRNGKDGSDGYSPEVSVSKSGTVTTITITDATGTKTAKINDGAKGDTGAPGAAGVDGKDGNDYILTASDKTEIAEMVEGAVIVQAPKYVNTTDEMTDTNRPYVLISTGHIWANAETTVETEGTVTDTVTGTYETGRFSSSGAVSADVNTHTITPYIDLTKSEYQGKNIQIHLEGNHYANATNETYVMCATFDSNKTVISGRAFTSLVSGGFLDDFDNAGVTLEILSDTSAVVTVPVPLVNDGGKTVGFMRFCGLGTATSGVYITYTDKTTTTGVQWFDTGTSYAPVLTDDEKTEIAESVADMIDAQLLSVIGDGSVTV